MQRENGMVKVNHNQFKEISRIGQRSKWIPKSIPSPKGSKGGSRGKGLQQKNILTKPLALIAGNNKTEYQIQFKAKQKVKKDVYGLSEKKLKIIINKGKSNLIGTLESRLDIVVFRLGYAQSLKQSRSLIRGGKILVNDVVKRFPDTRLRNGDLVTANNSGESIISKVGQLKMFNGGFKSIVGGGAINIGLQPTHLINKDAISSPLKGEKKGRESQKHQTLMPKSTYNIKGTNLLSLQHYYLVNSKYGFKENDIAYLIESKDPQANVNKFKLFCSK